MAQMGVARGEIILIIKTKAYCSDEQYAYYYAFLRTGSQISHL